MKPLTDSNDKIGKVWAERSVKLLPGGFFGILHCVQDDGKNLQRQKKKAKAKAKSKSKAKAETFGLAEVYFTPIAWCATDGAPGHLRWAIEEQTAGGGEVI
jgi:hypothetical protein